MSDKLYIKGFNHGYMLQKHEPKIFENLLKGIEGESPYKEGLRDGSKQYNQEHGKQLLKERMGKQNDNNLDNTHEYDR